MTDRENVINKVKAIVADMQEEVDEWKDYSDSELRGGLTCDCDWWYKTLQTLKDALALLKAQEPRVMTVADIVDNYVAPEVVWVEARNNKGDIRLVAGLWNGEYYNMADDSVMYDLGEEIANNPEGYNTRWRCWTSRPTDKQREATPWRL